jgi:hypothetical protein
MREKKTDNKIDEKDLFPTLGQQQKKGPNAPAWNHT